VRGVCVGGVQPPEHLPAGWRPLRKLSSPGATTVGFTDSEWVEGKGQA